MLTILNSHALRTWNFVVAFGVEGNLTGIEVLDACARFWWAGNLTGSRTRRSWTARVRPLRCGAVPKSVFSGARHSVEPDKNREVPGTGTEGHSRLKRDDNPIPLRPIPDNSITRCRSADSSRRERTSLVKSALRFGCVLWQEPMRFLGAQRTALFVARGARERFRLPRMPLIVPAACPRAVRPEVARFRS